MARIDLSTLPFGALVQLTTDDVLAAAREIPQNLGIVLTAD